MEEPQVRPGFPGDRSQAAAEKLRALRERANQALDDHRRRLGDIESQLGDRVRRLAEEFGATLGDGSTAQAAPPQEEILELRHQLEEGRVKHDKFIEQLSVARRQLDSLQSQPCAVCAQAAEQLTAAEALNRQLREQLEVVLHKHNEDCVRHEKFVEQLAAARQAITMLQVSAGESSAEHRGELEAARAAKAAVEQQLAAVTHDMAALHHECDALRAQSESSGSLGPQLATALAECDALREQAANSAALAEQARADEAQARQQLETLTAQLGGMQSTSTEELQALVDQLVAAEAAGDEARRELAAAQGEILKASLASSEADAAVQGLQRGLAAAEKRAAAAEKQAAEATALQKQLDEVRAADDERTQLTSDLTTKLDDARRELEELRATMVPRADAEALERSFAAAQETIAELQQAAAGQFTSMADVQSELAAAQVQLAAAQADGNAIHGELTAAQTELGKAQAALVEVTRDLAAAREYVQEGGAAQAELAKAQAALAETKQELTNALQHAAEGTASQAELAKAQAALTKTSQELAEAKKELEAAQVRAQTEGAAQAELTEAQAALAAVKRELADAQEAAQDELTQARKAAAEFEAQLAAVKVTAASSDAEMAAIYETMRPIAEFDALQQKFELALADVQKLKKENSGLREDLAARPEASDQESPELIGVRGERDALAARVAELEAAAKATPAADPESQREREDLQRRFEMAVDDVRQLKQENAELRDKVAAGGGHSHSTPSDAGGTDWASQRARLMALLEEEDDDSAAKPERTSERATVQKTIAATDRVVANKDQEIAELRTQLESRSVSHADASEAAKRDEVFDADAQIAAERERLAALTAEWESKLRAAELEFSVERAKLAREQAALRDKQLELEKGLPASSEPADPLDHSKPRRRWLSALGLHDEDGGDGKKKK